MKEFEETHSGWGLGLPPDISSDELRRLYTRNKPEFLPLGVVCEILDHVNCPVSILKDAYETFLKLRQEVDSCLAALGLRIELPTRQISTLANSFLNEDIGDHALGTLLRKIERTNDQKSRLAIARVLAMYPHPFRRRERDMVKWIELRLAEIKRRNSSRRSSRKK
jgi:hypothetical protein